MPDSIPQNYKSLSLPEIYEKAGGVPNVQYKLSCGIRTLSGEPKTDKTGSMTRFEYYDSLNKYHTDQASQLRGDDADSHKKLAETFRNMADSVQKAEQPRGTGEDKGGNKEFSRTSGGNNVSSNLDLVDFSMDLTDSIQTNSPYSYRTAPVAFRAGTYPDKQFAITPHELREAVTAFSSPVDLDLEHKQTVLSGKLGKLMSVSASPTATDFSAVSATVALPKWLDDMIPADKRKISLSFDRKTKRIKGCALTINPRIDEAALFAAFSATSATFDDGMMPPPEAAPQPIAGDIAPPPGGDMGGVLVGKKLFQAVYDLLNRSYTAAKENEGVYDSGYLKMLEKMLKMCNDGGADIVAMEDKGDGMGNKKENGNAQVGGDGGSTGPGFNKDSQSAQTSQTPQTTTPTPREIELEQKLAAERGRRNAENVKRIASEAVTFADDQIVNKKKAYPSEREAIIRAYVQCATADSKSSDTANFSLMEPGAQVQTFKMLYDSRPAHQLDKELLNVGDGTGTLPADFARPQGGGKMTAERRKQLMGTTELGRIALNGKNSKN